MAFSMGGTIGGLASQAGMNPSGTVDPWAGARTLATGGLSALYGAYTQGAKNDQSKAQQQYQDTINQQNTYNQGIAGQLGNAGQSYYNTIQGAQNAYQQARSGVDTQFNNYNNQYQQRTNALMSQATDQANNAATTYNQNIKPNLMNLMERAQTEAGGAMTLQQAGDVNNSIQTAVRGLYNTEAAGENQQGLANVGIMSALGAQALKGQLGSSMPMTGGQMAALQGQNMAQAGSAYALTQQRIQNLKDQGLQQGFVQSNLQYQRGQQAQQWAQDTANNLQNADQSFLGSQEQARSGINALSGQVYGSNMADVNRQYGNAAEDYGMSSNLGGIGYQNAVNVGNMQMGIGNQYYGQQRGVAAGNLGAANAQIQAQNQMLGGIIQTGATVAGGVYGGPMGAAMGQAGGGVVNQGIQAQNSYPNYGGGGYGSNGYAGGGGYGGGGQTGGGGGINPYMFQKNPDGTFANWQPQ